MHARLFLATCASLALLSAGACNNNSANTTDQQKAAPDNAAATKATSPAEDQQRPISLTGCLQKDGSDYVLTQINEPAAGTVAKSDPDKVEREQINAAEHSYQLNAKGDIKNDDLSKMVGRQVRVEGTLAKRSDLGEKVGTSGSNDHTRADDNDRTKIHESDLAQVDVSQIQQVAAACGGHAAKARAKTAKPRK